jgi:hypothetical protein
MELSSRRSQKVAQFAQTDPPGNQKGFKPICCMPSLTPPTWTRTVRRAAGNRAAVHLGSTGRADRSERAARLRDRSLAPAPRG